MSSEQPPPGQGSDGSDGGWNRPPSGGWASPGGGNDTPQSPGPPADWMAAPQGGPGWQGWAPPPPPPTAPKPGVVPLRPLAFGEILDGAFTTIQRYPTILLGFSAILFAVVAVINYVLANALVPADLLTELSDPTGPTLTQQQFQQDLTELLSALLLVVGISVLLQWIVGVILTGIVTATAARGVLGQPATVRSTWQQVRGRLLRLLLLTLLIGLAFTGVLVATILISAFAIAALGALGGLVTFGALVGAIVLMLFLWVRWAVAGAALVLESRAPQWQNPVGDSGRRPIGVFEAMGRSARLTKGRAWRTLGVLLVATLIAAVVAGILQVAFSMLAGLVPDTLGWLGADGAAATGQTVVSSIGLVSGSMLQMAFLAAVNVLIYTDARMRAEGLDIELTAASAQAPGADANGAWSSTTNWSSSGGSHGEPVDPLAPWTLKG